MRWSPEEEDLRATCLISFSGVEEAKMKFDIGTSRTKLQRTVDRAARAAFAAPLLLCLFKGMGISSLIERGQEAGGKLSVVAAEGRNELRRGALMF